jgi:hypothetical protein
MSNLTGTNTRSDHDGRNGIDVRTGRRISSETKPSYKTTELIAFVLAVLGVLIASAVVDKSDFGAQEAWRYITFLTIGYMVSRGLAKSGSRNFHDDDDRDDVR